MSAEGKRIAGLWRPSPPCREEDIIEIFDSDAEMEAKDIGSDEDTVIIDTTVKITTKKVTIAEVMMDDPMEEDLQNLAAIWGEECHFCHKSIYGVDSCLCHT